MTIKNNQHQDIDIETLREGELLCLQEQKDYCFLQGKKYKIHYDDSDGNEGAYIFGTKTGFLGIFGDSDCTWLHDLTQDILNKFVLL